MTQYIDGFLLPVPQNHLNAYKRSAEKIAEIWKEYGALAYFEYVGEDLKLDGTRSFIEAVDLKEIRDIANKAVPKDPRMADLVDPLIDSKRIIFDPERMFYGGFRSFIQSSKLPCRDTQ